MTNIVRVLFDLCKKIGCIVDWCGVRVRDTIMFIVASRLSIESHFVVV